MKKLIYGVGYNPKGDHKTKMESKAARAYSAWMNMLKRCYDSNTQLKRPTYIGCSIAKEWHNFQNFAGWFYNHPYSDLNYDLDKDLLLCDNKIYSSDTCCFVPAELNKLLNSNAASRGELPQGVHWNKERYKAQISLDGKRRHLGYFDSVDCAYNAYKNAKEAYVKEKALEWQDRIAENVFQALMDWQLTN